MFREGIQEAKVADSGAMKETGVCFLPTSSQRLEFFFAMVIVHFLDHLVSTNLTESGVLSPEGNRIVTLFEDMGGILLLVLGIVTFIALIKPIRKLTIPACAIYLSFAVIHLTANEGAILLTAETRRGQSLVQLWDVVVVYFMGVFVFTAWYWFLDRITPGGAFIFPSDSKERCNRTLIDYIFISFNTSATFGPTTETPTSPVAKVLMMVQVCFSILVLTVLLARAISM